MKRSILFLIISSLIVSCSVRIERRLYNKGFYVHRATKNNPAPVKEVALALKDTTHQVTHSQPDHAGQPVLSKDQSAPSIVQKTKKEVTPAPAVKHRIPFIFNNSEDTVKVLTVHPLVGEVIDSTEKVKYRLFSFWDNRNFSSARFIEKDGSIFLEGTMKDGEVKTVPFSELEYNKTNTLISTPVKEDVLDEDVVTVLLIILYVFLALLLIVVLAILSFLLLILSPYLGSLAIAGSIGLMGIVIRAMVNSIEDRMYL